MHWKFIMGLAWFLIGGVCATTAQSVLNPPSVPINASRHTQPQAIDHYHLVRPIEQIEGKTHWVDRTYPYGGTQFGTREVHLGVEFVNTRFTPVQAAASGTVLFAGTDSSTQLGPRLNYYGNVVLIQHDFLSPEGLPVFTLYGHLQDIAVQLGQRLGVNDRVGRVGDTGIAIGPHLHFEVRVGNGFDYRQTRNPELWILPYWRYGTLAGTVRSGEPFGVVIRLRSADFSRETYTYGDTSVNSDAAWGETFTLGDIPIGNYEVLISTETGRVLFRETVTIRSRQTTFVEINLE